MSEIPESKKPGETIGKQILDAWDLKHFKRVPVANSSFQYEIREDMIKMIDSEIEQLQKQNKELVETLKKLFDVVERHGVQEYSECLASDYTDYTVDALDVELENSQKVLAKYQKDGLK